MSLQLEESEILNLYTTLLYKPKNKSRGNLPPLPNSINANVDVKYATIKKRNGLTDAAQNDSQLNISETSVLSENTNLRYVQSVLGISGEISEKLLLNAVKLGNQNVWQKELNLYAYYLTRDRGVYRLDDFDSADKYSRWRNDEKTRLDDLTNMYYLDPMDYLIGTNENIIPIRVSCFKAQGLLTKGKGGVCNAYCTIELNGKIIASGFVADDTTEPMWDLNQIILIDGTKPQELNVQIWDKTGHGQGQPNTGTRATWSDKDAFLGKCTMRVDNDFHDEEGWYKLEKRSARSHVTGKVYISIDKINQSTRLSDLYSDSFVCIPSNPRQTFSKVLRLFYEYDTKMYEAMMVSDTARRIVKQLKDLWRIDNNTWAIESIKHATEMLLGNQVSLLQFNANIVGCLMSSATSVEFLPGGDLRTYIECRDIAIVYITNKIKGYLLSEVTHRSWDDFRIATMMLADIYGAVSKSIGQSSRQSEFFEEFKTTIVAVIEMKMENVYNETFGANVGRNKIEILAIVLKRFLNIVELQIEYFGSAKCLTEFGHPLNIESNSMKAIGKLLTAKLTLDELKFESEEDIANGMKIYEQLVRFYEVAKILDATIIYGFTLGADIIVQLFTAYSKKMDASLRKITTNAIQKDDFSVADQETPYSTSFKDVMTAFGNYADALEQLVNVNTQATKALVTNLLSSIVFCGESYMSKLRDIALKETRLIVETIENKKGGKKRKNSTVKLAPIFNGTFISKNGGEGSISSLNSRTLPDIKPKLDPSKFDAEVVRIPKTLCLKMADICYFVENLVPTFTTLSTIKRSNLYNSRTGEISSASVVDTGYLCLTMDLGDITRMRPRFPFSSRIKVRILKDNLLIYESKSFQQSATINIADPVYILQNTEHCRSNIEVQIIQISPWSLIKNASNTTALKNKEFLVDRKTFTLDIEAKNELRGTKTIQFNDDYGTLSYTFKAEEAIVNYGIGVESDFLMKLLKLRSDIHTTKVVDSIVNVLCCDMRDSIKSASRKYKTHAQTLVSLLTDLKLRDAFTEKERARLDVTLDSSVHEGNDEITLDKVSEDLSDLLYFVNENLAIIVDSLEVHVAHRIIKEVWVNMLWILESCLVPELEEGDSKEIWEPNRLLFMLYTINIFLELFNAEGEGIPIAALKSEIFTDLMAIVSNYNLPVDEIKIALQNTAPGSAHGKRGGSEFTFFSKKINAVSDEIIQGNGLLRLLKLRREDAFVAESLKKLTGAK